MHKGTKIKAYIAKHKAPSGLVLLLVLVALVLASCAGGGSSSGGGTTSGGETTSQAHNMGGTTGMEHGEKGMQGTAMEMPTVDPAAAGLRVDLTSDPAHARPNQQTALHYLITGENSSTPLTSFPTEHERPMHLVAVSQDLSQFQHIHPEVGADGSWTVSTTFPETANYVLFDEFAYNGQQVLDRREFTVGEASPTSASLSPDLNPKTESGLTISLSAPQSITAGEDETLTLQVTRDGQPVTDLEPYLGAPAHVVIISSDTRNFAHTHGEVSGMESMDSPPPSALGPDITVHHTFPKAGLYKIWFQFGYQGSVITVPYVVEVK
jgi:hypothetical protein